MPHPPDETEPLADETPDNEVNPWVVLGVVSTGFFMVVLDVTILHVAMPTLATEFGARMAEVEWALIAYTLVMTGTVPIFGRISDVLGRKRLFIGGVALFTVGSAFAAMSTSIAWLVVARIGQGAGAALVASNTLAIVTDAFPAGERGTALGFQTIVNAGGAALGPTVGGVIVTHYGWEGVFLINVPIGIVVIAGAAWILPPLESHRTMEPVDWLGGGLLLSGLTLALLGLTFVPAHGWGSSRVVWSLVAGVSALVGFVAREHRAEYPMVEFDLFDNRDFTVGQLSAVCAMLTFSSMAFLFPFYWQKARGFTAQATGLLMLPLPLTIGIMSPIAGRISDRLGARGIASAGMLTIGVALVFLAQIGVDTPIWDVLWRFVLLGIGIGSFLAPNKNSVMSAVDAEHRGIAAGLLGMFKYTGRSVGVVFGGMTFGTAVGAAVDFDPAAGELGTDAAAAFAENFSQGFAAVCLTAAGVAVVGTILSLQRNARGAEVGG